MSRATSITPQRMLGLLQVLALACLLIFTLQILFFV